MILGSNQITKIKNRTINPKNSVGLYKAAQRPAKTAMSSAMDAVQLVKGSGEVLINNRVPALVTWEVAAIPPPMMPAAISNDGQLENKTPETASGDASARFDQLAKLKSLLDSGAINEAEFEQEKQRLLSN